MKSICQGNKKTENTKKFIILGVLLLSLLLLALILKEVLLSPNHYLNVDSYYYLYRANNLDRLLDSIKLYSTDMQRNFLNEIKPLFPIILSFKWITAESAGLLNFIFIVLSIFFASLATMKANSIKDKSDKPSPILLFTILLFSFVPLYYLNLLLTDYLAVLLMSISFFILSYRSKPCILGIIVQTLLTFIRPEYMLLLAIIFIVTKTRWQRFLFVIAPHTLFSFYLFFSRNIYLSVDIVKYFFIVSVSLLLVYISDSTTLKSLIEKVKSTFALENIFSKINNWSRVAAILGLLVVTASMLLRAFAITNTNIPLDSHLRLYYVLIAFSPVVVWTLVLGVLHYLKRINSEKLSVIIVFISLQMSLLFTNPLNFRYAITLVFMAGIFLASDIIQVLGKLSKKLNPLQIFVFLLFIATSIGVYDYHSTTKRTLVNANYYELRTEIIKENYSAANSLFLMEEPLATEVLSDFEVDSVCFIPTSKIDFSGNIYIVDDPILKHRCPDRLADFKTRITIDKKIPLEAFGQIASETFNVEEIIIWKLQY